MSVMKHPSLIAALLWLVFMPSPAAAQDSVTVTSELNAGQGTFGEPSYSTFGQTFVAPTGMDTLDSFAFYVNDGVGPLAFQAFIMEWSGLRATGPILFQSGPLVTTDNGGLDGFERIQISISGGLSLNAGTSYVAFFSTSNLFDGINEDGEMGANFTADGSGYTGGRFVAADFLDDFSKHTTQDWDDNVSFFLIDLAFEFVFSKSTEGGTTVSQPILVVDVDAIASALFSSVPTALAQRELALGASRTALRDFNGRLFRQRAGSGSATTADTQEEENADYHTVTVGEGDGDGAKGTKVAYATSKPEEYQCETFSSFDYGSFDLDADRSFLGLRSDTYVGSVGAERSLNPHLLLGAGASWIESNSDRATDVDGVTLAAYASAKWKGLHADLLYGATLLDHDIDRLTGLGSTVHAKPGSTTHTVAFNTGWNFQLGSWTTGPFAGLDYSHAQIDGYTEEGGSRAATRVSEQNIGSLITRVGWQVSRRAARPWGAITPQIRIGWERENLESDDELTVSLLQSPYYLVQGTSVRSTGAGFNAIVQGQDRERDYMTVGAGVLIEFGRRFHVLLDYEGLLLADGYSAHFGKLAVGWRF